MRFLITTLAEYQTVFWLKVGLQLKQSGHEAAFLSFDDRSTEMLKAAGLQTFSGTDRPDAAVADSPAFDEMLQRFGISDLNFWFGHERFAFDVRDATQLRRKLMGALLAADDACRSMLAQGPVTMVQELGGFLSVIGSYFASRHYGIDNWFAEPSFFRGRLFFLRNGFGALAVDKPLDEAPQPEVVHYLDETVRKGAIVVPLKDRHQYTTAWKKIVNTKNARRLFEKLVDKHLRGKKQEFGHIGTHVRTHARMLWSSFRLHGSYTPLAQAGRFVYYPLHVPGDMALTLRTPHLLDQLAVIDFLCRSVPHSHRVAIKEHPAMVGAIDAGRVQALLRRHDNLVLLPPSTNNFEVLVNADAVVSINSKSGAEAALLGKPVLVLGDAFYRGSPLVDAVNRMQDLPKALAQSLQLGFARPSRDLVLRYFSAVWRQSVPGELYDASEPNIATFTRSMVSALATPDS
jgi:hypothetical protein